MSLPTNFFIGRGGGASALTEYINQTAGNFTTHISNVYTYRGLTTTPTNTGYARRWVLTSGQTASETIRFGTIDRTTGVWSQTHTINSSFSYNQRDRFYDGTRVYVLSYTGDYLYYAAKSNLHSTNNVSLSSAGMSFSGNGNSPWGLAYQNSNDRLHMFAYSGDTWYIDNVSTYSPTGGSTSGNISWYDGTGTQIDACCGTYDYDADVFYIGAYNNATGKIFVCNPDGSYVDEYSDSNRPSTNIAIDAMHYDDGMLVVQYGGNEAIGGVSGYNMRCYSKNI